MRNSKVHKSSCHLAIKGIRILLVLFGCSFPYSWDLNASLSMPQGMGLGLGYSNGKELVWRSEVNFGSAIYYSAMDIRSTMQFFPVRDFSLEWGVGGSVCRIWNEVNGYGMGPLLGLGYKNLGLRAGVQRLAISVPIAKELYWQRAQYWWLSFYVRLWRSSP